MRASMSRCNLICGLDPRRAEIIQLVFEHLAVMPVVAHGAGRDRRQRQAAEDKIIHHLVELQVGGRRAGRGHSHSSKSQDSRRNLNTLDFSSLTLSNPKASSCASSLLRYLRRAARVQREQQIMPLIISHRLVLCIDLRSASPAHAAELRSQVQQYRLAHEADIVGEIDALTRLKSIAADPAGLAATAHALCKPR